MAKKEEQVEVVEPEVVEDRVTKDIAIRQASAQRTDIKKAITRQVATVQGVELRGNLEKLKLGAMVSEAVRILKLEDAAANRGRNSEGGGALGWWNDVCPADESGAPVIPYRTVMMWKQAAENLPLIMGKGVMDAAKILALMAKNPKKVVGKDAKIIASAEKAANGMTMRQMLLWGDSEPVKGKKSTSAAEKAKCRFCDPSGTCCCKKSKHFDEGCPAKRCGMFERESYAKTAEDRIAEAEEQTRELMGKIGAYFRGKWFETVSEQTKNDFIRSLKDWAEVASERM